MHLYKIFSACRYLALTASVKFRKSSPKTARNAGNGLLRIVIIDIVINTLVGRVTRHPAGMHCPAGDDAFVSSSKYCLYYVNYLLFGQLTFY